MRVPYYPGCTLLTKARGFDRATRASMRVLGVELAEVADWNCCGASFPLSVQDMLALAGSARVMASARAEGDELATVCAGCFNVLKRTNRLLRQDADRREKVNLFIEADYAGDLRVLHMLQILHGRVGLGGVRSAVVRPLNGLKVASYYGCMLLRPRAELELDDAENPHLMEELFEALGARAVRFPYQTECCGAYLSINSAQIAWQCSYAVLASARAHGAEVIATSCPLCQFNLDKAQQQMERQSARFQPLPVVYFTEILALGLGLPEAETGLGEYYIDLRPILEGKGLLVRA